MAGKISRAGNIAVLTLTQFMPVEQSTTTLIAIASSLPCLPVLRRSNWGSKWADTSVRIRTE